MRFKRCAYVRSYRVAFLIFPSQHYWCLRLGNPLYLGSFLVHYRILAHFWFLPTRCQQHYHPILQYRQLKMSLNIAKWTIGAKLPPVENHWYKALKVILRYLDFILKSRGVVVCSSMEEKLILKSSHEFKSRRIKGDYSISKCCSY